MTKNRQIFRKQYPIPPLGRIGLSLDEVCGLTGFGMTSVRQAIDAGLLPAHRFGKKIIVRRQDIDPFLRNLPRGIAKKALALKPHDRQSREPPP